MFSVRFLLAFLLVALSSPAFAQTAVAVAPLPPDPLDDRASEQVITYLENECNDDLFTPVRFFHLAVGTFLFLFGA
jgi:hypothetical protein